MKEEVGALQLKIVMLVQKQSLVLQMDFLHKPI